MVISDRWDSFFYHIAQDCASMSRCHSRQIGAVIVRDKRILATGYNGPPSGIVPCHERYKKDEYLQQLFTDHDISPQTLCPRQQLGAKSGALLDLCPAAHAEANAIVNAARLGVSIFDATMYMTCCIPCVNCLALIINSGIREIVCTSFELYHKTCKFMLIQSDLEIRLFDEFPLERHAYYNL